MWQAAKVAGARRTPNDVATPPSTVNAANRCSVLAIRHPCVIGHARHQHLVQCRRRPPQCPAYRPGVSHEIRQPDNHHEHARCGNHLPNRLHAESDATRKNVQPRNVSDQPTRHRSHDRQQDQAHALTTTLHPSILATAESDHRKRSTQSHQTDDREHADRDRQHHTGRALCRSRCFGEPLKHRRTRDPTGESHRQSPDVIPHSAVRFGSSWRRKRPDRPQSRCHQQEAIPPVQHRQAMPPTHRARTGSTAHCSIDRCRYRWHHHQKRAQTHAQGQHDQRIPDRCWIAQRWKPARRRIDAVHDRRPDIQPAFRTSSRCIKAAHVVTAVPAVHRRRHRRLCPPSWHQRLVGFEWIWCEVTVEHADEVRKQAATCRKTAWYRTASLSVDA